MAISLAIVGHGFHGKAVDLGFDHRIEFGPVINKHIIDPTYQTNFGEYPSYYSKIKDLVGQKVDIAFICVPTEEGPNGSVDASLVEEAVDELMKIKNCLIVIKSTVTPTIVKDLHAKCDRVVYSPSFMTESEGINGFTNPPMHIFGGDLERCKQVYSIFENYSQCTKNIKALVMSPAEASFVKYAINSFLATKVIWMNQLKDITDRHGVNYKNVVAGMIQDPRIGESHMELPWDDNTKGFGGKGFPKDTKAFTQFAGQFPILQDVINYNEKYRKK